MGREQILNQAMKCVCQDRNNIHGEPEDTFNKHALLWSSYLSAKFNQEIELTELDVAWLMVLFKVGRSVANPKHEDNYVDAAGYVSCAGELAEDL